MSPIAPNIGRVSAPVIAPYWGADISPTAAAFESISATGATVESFGSGIDLQALAPSMPTLGTAPREQAIILTDGGDAGASDGTVVAIYRGASTPFRDSVLVAWDPILGTVDFISKLDSNNEAIGGAVQRGTWLYWPEYTWVEDPSPEEFRVNLKRGKADLSTSVTTLGTWIVETPDPNTTDFRLFAPSGSKIGIADEILIALEYQEFDPIGGEGPEWNAKYVWWRFALNGTTEARGTLSFGQWNGVPDVGLDLGGSITDPGGVGGNETLQTVDVTDPTSRSNQWPAVLPWTEGPWRSVSVSKDGVDALLHSGITLIRDSIVGPHEALPVTTVILASSQDVVGFRL